MPDSFKRHQLPEFEIPADTIVPDTEKEINVQFVKLLNFWQIFGILEK